MCRRAFIGLAWFSFIGPLCLLAIQQPEKVIARQSLTVNTIVSNTKDHTPVTVISGAKDLKGMVVDGEVNLASTTVKVDKTVVKGSKKGTIEKAYLETYRLSWPHLWQETHLVIEMK